jgi:hypothetical protein
MHACPYRMHIASDLLDKEQVKPTEKWAKGMHK